MEKNDREAGPQQAARPPRLFSDRRERTEDCVLSTVQREEERGKGGIITRARVITEHAGRGELRGCG